MRKHLVALSSLCLVLTACDTTSGSGSSHSSGSTQGSQQHTQGQRDQQGQASDNQHPSSYSATNTGRNVRDRNDQALTAGNQGENEADRTITQQIRQAVVDDDSLSTNAKNVKIITLNGVVTLRGPVSNDREKNEIAKKVRGIQGVKNVDNQLEVSRSDTGSSSGSSSNSNNARTERSESNR